MPKRDFEKKIKIEPVETDFTSLSLKKNQNTANRVEPEAQLRTGAMKMLGWLASSHPIPLTKQRVATLSGFSLVGGTFNT